MIDSYGRTIDYLRISVTDRCNMRCCYCMPDGLLQHACHEEILRYEEILRVVKAAADLGIRHYRITGGEPLMRRGISDLIRGMKQLDGVVTVSMTTNGFNFPSVVHELKEAGLDSVNISLDSLDDATSSAVNGVQGAVSHALDAIRAAREAKIPVKVNTVLLQKNASSIIPLSKLCVDGIPVRFIELMPIGYGKLEQGLPLDAALSILRKEYPDLKPDSASLGNGPARYFSTQALPVPIGIIDAVSHSFCSSCNRIRLTSTGKIKPCLCYGEEIDLLQPMRNGIMDDALQSLILQAIQSKPMQHRFSVKDGVTEHRNMSQIGG